MIKKLRRKFILTNMLLVTLVLGAVFAAQVASAYQRVVDQSYASLRTALTWQETDDSPRFKISMDGEVAFFERYSVTAASTILPPPVQIQGKAMKAKLIQLPSFVVETDETGELIALTPGSNTEITQEVSQALAIEAISTQSSTGILPQADLRFMQELTPAGTTKLAFVSRSWEVETLWNQLSTGVVLGLLSLVGFFFISLFLSGILVRPLERSWAQQRQFVADASHELKTPLTVILANTSILLSHPEDPISSHEKWLEDCQSEAQQMKGLVDDMLFLAKHDAAKAPALHGEVELSELVQSACLTFESVAFEAQVTLESQVSPGLTLLGDGDTLRRLVAILLDNACKYAGAGGGVEVSLAREREELKLSVHNSGLPIPPEHLDHLFDRFYRADTARSRQEGGYGLGLSIAKSIAEAHRGRISVASGEGGTTFTVTLPLQ